MLYRMDQRADAASRLEIQRPPGRRSGYLFSGCGFQGDQAQGPPVRSGRGGY